MGILYDRLLILLNESSSDSTFYHIALAMLQNMELLHSLAINAVHTHRTAYPFISGMIAWRYREAIHKKTGIPE